MCFDNIQSCHLWSRWATLKPVRLLNKIYAMWMRQCISGDASFLCSVDASADSGPEMPSEACVWHSLKELNTAGSKCLTYEQNYWLILSNNNDSPDPSVAFIKDIKWWSSEIAIKIHHRLHWNHRRSNNRTLSCGREAWCIIKEKSMSRSITSESWGRPWYYFTIIIFARKCWSKRCFVISLCWRLSGYR